MAEEPPRPEGATILTAARAAAGLSQRALAARAGTSPGTLAGYESGTKDPRLSTALRLVHACGASLTITRGAPSAATAVPPSATDPTAAARDRHEQRSLALHRVVAEELRRDPGGVMAHARANLTRLRAVHDDGSAARWLDEWETLLTMPVEVIADVLAAPTPHARELRQTSPFAGVVPPRRRWDIYREYRKEARRAS